MTYELFKIQVDGKTYFGTYHLRMPMVHVTSPLGSKAAPKGGAWPKDTAERLLKEIVAESEQSDDSAIALLQQAA
jgi:hypothetical protein